jgi:uncharacterized protein (AIM24 family)
MIFTCNLCGFSREVPDSYAGKSGKCPQCKGAITIPQVPSVSPTPTPAVQPVAADNSQVRYSLADFVKSSAQKDRKGGIFELESPQMLEINLDGMVWTKMGSMVAYNGSIKFTREGVLDGGLGNLLKKSVTGEGAKLTKAEGKGALYLADSGKKISIIHLQNESLVVNGNDLLAFESSISSEITMMKSLAGVLAGGLFNVRLTGRGLIAITTHHDPLTLQVSPNRPVFTDPNATVAWSGSLTPEFKTDTSLKTFIGRGSGESMQMKFQGTGFVVVQPFEEIYLQNA